MRICGVNECPSVNDRTFVPCKRCSHYVDADKIIDFLLDELESQHTGLKETYKDLLKEDFGYEKDVV